MFDMFGFMDMADNYGERKVARYEEGVVMVDTCAVTDSDQPYETAVAHPLYNNGDIIIVEMYDDKAASKVGHDKWVKIMTEGELPNELRDVSSNCIATMIRDMDDMIFEKDPE